MTTTYEAKPAGCYRTGTIGPYGDTLNTFLLNAIIERHNADTIVLARYMQILPPG